MQSCALTYWKSLAYIHQALEHFGGLWKRVGVRSRVISSDRNLNLVPL